MILFYLKEAVRILKRSSFATFVTIFITAFAITLTVLSVFLLVEANELSNRIKKSIEVNVYLDNLLSSGEILALQNQIQAEHGVLLVQMISKEEAINEFIKETGNDFRKVLDSNPLPNSFIVKFKPSPLDQNNIELFVNKYRKINGITEVVYDYKTVLKLLSYLKSSEKVVYIFSFVLVILSLYLVYSNNKVQIQNSSNLYLTMKLVGAKTVTMKIPIVLNGMIIGLIASVICIILYNLMFILLTKFYDNLNFIPEMNYVNIIILAIGIVLGLIGSLAASNKIQKVLET
jgi:cell division transport system permease protein